MRLCVHATETGGRHFQLVLTDDAVIALLLSGQSPELWRKRRATAGGTGTEPHAAIARVVEWYRRLGAAALNESADNFVLPWDAVHEVRFGGGPLVCFCLTSRGWFGRRQRRTFRVEPSDGRDADQILADIEQELYGRVPVRR